MIRVQALFVLFLGACLSASMVMRAAGRETPAGDDLADTARSAAAAIRQHQKAEGYWLTAYTPAARFEHPRPEMNVYLTSLMVDLLDPVAKPAGLDDTIAAARLHLTEQIESTGLVRYHGRPDSPSIRAGLGCNITPDSDDTVLVWSVAPRPERELLKRALDVLKQYLTPAGLYRIWLEPRQEYSCIDPGTDPNPADAGVQLHVYLLLAKSDPPAARALCDSLKKTIGEDRLWVYSTVAPLENLLRREEVQRAGCALSIPEAKLATPVAGQEIWVAAARLLERLRNPAGRKPSSGESHALLEALSRDSFSRVRQTPPLLYHNDFSGKVPRFYWSEDYGYALWLRLYLENARVHGDMARSL